MDLNTRSNMLLASHKAGLAFSKSFAFFESVPARLAGGHIKADRIGIRGHFAVLQIADVAHERKLEIALSGLQSMDG